MLVVSRLDTWVENMGKGKPFLSVHLTVSGSFYCEDADGDVCVSPELSIWGFEFPKLEKQKSTKKEKKSSKILSSRITIVNFLVLFALLVFFPPSLCIF